MATKVTESGLNATASIKLTSGVFATCELTTAVEPVALHCQNDFETVTCLTQRPVFLRVCAGDAVLPSSTSTSVPLTVSHRSSSGGGGVAGPALGCDRAQLVLSHVAESEPERRVPVKRGRIEPNGTPPNKCLEPMRPRHVPREH
jgi:hypothetical protein